MVADHKHFYDKDMSWLESFKGCGRAGNVYAEFATRQHSQMYLYGTWYQIDYLLEKPGGAHELKCGPQDAGWWIYICKDCAERIGLIW